MPTRRTTLLGLGLLTAGGAGAAATGAFTAATAERTVNVTTGDETEAILAFQPTSDYASITDGQLQIDFNNLNANANFTFEDTFIIVNNSNMTVSLDSVGTNESDNTDGLNWRNEDSSAAVGVLIGDSVNEWQGNPNPDFFDTEVVDPDPNSNTDGGYYDFDDIDAGNVDVVMESQDWVSIGFQFGTSDSVGGWNGGDVPNSLRFEFGQVSGQ